MKNIRKVLGALVVLGAGFSLLHAAQTCQRTDLQCYESGSSQNLLTPFRVDSSGNITFIGTGTSSFQSNVVEGLTGNGTLSSATGTNTALAVPILVSSNVTQGQPVIIVSTTVGNSGYVSGALASASNATTVLGVADATASSGTVVNVDFSGISVALATGSVSVGDLLVSSNNSTTLGFVGTNNSASAGAIIGTALTPLTAAGSPGLVRVLLHH